MTMTCARFAILALLLGSWTGPASAQADAREADRAQLRSLLAGVEQALNGQDLDAIVPLLHPEVVVTYQNGEVTRGIDQVRSFYDRMLIGPEAVVKEFSTRPSVSAPATFHGDTAVAHGTTEERYVLAEGLDFTLDTRWTATVARDGGAWKVASLHFSGNLFDNPILTGTRRTVWMAAGGGLLAGMLLMLLFGRLRRR